MSEPDPVIEPVAPAPPEPAPPTPPVVDKPKDDNNLLNTLEKDFIAQLKDKINLEDFADLDQKSRIMAFRALSKNVTKVAEKPPEKPTIKKGEAKDPTVPPPITTDGFQSNLQKNNLKEYNADMRKKNSIHNITSQIRGGKVGKLN